MIIHLFYFDDDDDDDGDDDMGLPRLWWKQGSGGLLRAYAEALCSPRQPHKQSLPEKTPSYSVGPGDSPWYFSVATAAYHKGQAQRTSAKAGEIWRNRDRVPEPGRNQFRAALRMGSSQQSTIMRFRTYKESRPFRHAHFINTVKLSTTFPSRSLGREHLPKTAASETLTALFGILMVVFGI